MKNLFFLLLAGLLAVESSAQKVFFVYFQSEDYTPFYIRLSDKVFSSSASGYLILPNLTDSTYTLAVGFAKSTQPEARFSVSVNQGDKGYLLKNLQDGLTLFDLQALTLTRSGNAVQKDETAYETKTDRFSTILSKAADDPSVLKTPVAPKKEPATEVEIKSPVIVAQEPVVKKEPETVQAKDLPSVVETTKTPVADSVQTNAGTTTVETPKTEPEKKVPEIPRDITAYKLSVVIRRSESSTTEGFGIMYIDQAETGADTIRILIPPSKYTLTSDAQEKGPATAIDVTFKDTSGSKKVEIITSNNADTTLMQPPATQNPTVSGCKSIAADKDFLKLRKNMAAKVSDEEMVEEAKKAFKKQCYSVEQVRYLSTLFLTPAAKYSFFDVAYTHVSDKETFATLAQEIKDDYYLKRFKALAGE